MSERESEDSIHIIAFFILEIGILSLELLRRIFFFIAAERAAMKNHSAAKAAAAKAHARQLWNRASF